MKYAQHITEEIKQTLQEMYKKHPKARCRQRAQAIFLSAQGYSILQLTKIAQVRRNAISDWIDRWNTEGLLGLYDLPRSGRTPIYNEQDLKLLESLIAEEPRKIKQAHAKMAEMTGKKASIFTVKNALKKNELRLETLPAFTKSKA